MDGFVGVFVSLFVCRASEQAGTYVPHTTTRPTRPSGILEKLAVTAHSDSIVQAPKVGEPISIFQAQGNPSGYAACRTFHVSIPVIYNSINSSNAGSSLQSSHTDPEPPRK